MEFLHSISDEQIQRITTIILDIDGVMTDGHIGYGTGSNEEIKFFNVRDGLGARIAMRGGLKIGVLSGRRCAANTHRIQELGFSFDYQGCFDKLEGFETLLKEQNLTPEECLYMGDDIVDLPPMKRAGIGVTVPDNDSSLDEVADLRTSHAGGNGAVREVIEFILKGQGKWEKATEKYYR